MTKQKGKGYQGIRLIQAFEQKVTLNVAITEKTICQTTAKYTKNLQGTCKVTPDIDGFTD